MLDCLILGDSIAIGTHVLFKECELYAKTSITSSQWNQRWTVQKLDAKTVIISLGTNDHRNIKSRDELITMRSRVNAERVFWILPAATARGSGLSVVEIQEIIKDIADTNDDYIIEIKSLDIDKTHPSWTGYHMIADEIKEKLN